MGYGDVFADAGKGMVGLVEKAVLKILDVSSETEMETVDPVGKKGSSVWEKFMKMGAEKQSLSERFSKIKGFKVQFNPSSFSITGSGGVFYAERDFQNSKRPQDASSEESKPSLSMNVDLVFNKVDPMDAFTQEKILLSNVGNLKGISKRLAMGASQGRTVQPEVEALMAVLQHNKMSMINFVWGKMSYVGVLRRVKADYKMFNPKGEPVYATVGLEIILTDPVVSEKASGYWMDSYKKAFEQSEDLNNKNYVQKFAGSYLNVNL